MGDVGVVGVMAMSRKGLMRLVYTVASSVIGGLAVQNRAETNPYSGWVDWRASVDFEMRLHV